MYVFNVQLLQIVLLIMVIVHVTHVFQDLLNKPMVNVRVQQSIIVKLWAQIVYVNNVKQDINFKIQDKIVINVIK